MFKSVLVLGHFRGIRFEIHISWLIIFALLMVSMSTGFQQHYPDWSMTTAIGTALVTSLVFFASIVAHELGHSLVAISRGVPVRAITLFVFGGVAQMVRDPERANDEFWIAIAGPVVSFALALTFGLLAGLTAEWYEPVSVALGWLALINLVVAVFNLVPGFPLDGGRVLRALVWKVTGDARKGNLTARVSGRMVAYGLFGVALWNILVIGNLVGGLWIMLIAWFLLTMTQAQSRLFDMRERLAGIVARDLAEAGVPSVDADCRLDDWVYHHALPAGRRAAMVGNPDRVEGLISLSDTQRIPREQWPDTPVAAVMTPLKALHHVAPDTPADAILQLMNEHSLNQVPVMQGRRVSGWIDRQRLLRTIELYLEVGR
ncbi:site-2 protease family protein [Halomonas campisalis]|uniref:Zinc metalloprotease n=1 Tax=Billgrantia campisalis TaxID=74661 RepID=A0ABS9P847_9GAMM|nr:site-2 protease family protein [Halomonas campisalis]MCG6657942.1 site-2 protease family protein [Halomonas campisalis]MDR5863533.1 site-2 protease family protein [Halomonas campisalis]